MTNFDKLKEEISQMSIHDFLLFLLYFEKCDLCDYNDTERGICEHDVCFRTIKKYLEKEVK